MTAKYYYRCQCVRVVDGDSVYLAIDMGIFITSFKTCRLLGPGGGWLDAPETRGAEKASGLKSKARLTELIAQANSDLHCRTHLDRSDKYGRLLVELFPYEGAEKSFNEMLLDEGLAVPYPKPREI